MSELKDLMTGECHGFAIFLHEISGLPLYGLLDDEGNIHHAFVLNDKTAFDARGAVPLALVSTFDRRKSAGTKLEPLTVDRLKDGSRKGYPGYPLAESQRAWYANYVKKHRTLFNTLPLIVTR